MDLKAIESGSFPSPTAEPWELEVALIEYTKLKDEQIKRIEFRDQMVHVHLALVGGAMGWALGHKAYHVLLVVPWICTIIGWAALINDDRVSAIGSYLRLELTSTLRSLGKSAGSGFWGWEKVHRSDTRRRERKYIQLLIDEIAFVLPAVVSLVAYCWYSHPQTWLLKLIVACELAVVFGLGALIFRYSDISVDGTDSKPIVRPVSADSSEEQSS